MVRGLKLPELLLQLMSDGRWEHPGDAKLREVMPWFEDPLIFLRDADHVRLESRSLDMFADDERSSALFRVARGSDLGKPLELPWLDADLAVLVAVNRNIGDDVAIALDYRVDAVDPRVVASDFWTDPAQCAWRVVAPSFSAFTAMLKL